jgi:hypothetical protein
VNDECKASASEDEDISEKYEYPIIHFSGYFCEMQACTTEYVIL